MYKKFVEDRELDLSMSNLSELNTREIRSLTKVDSVDLSCNQLKELPEDFGDLEDQIVRLDISKNQLTHLPSSIGQLRSLQHLDLRGNRLKVLPPSFCHLTKLRWLDLKDNELEPGLAKAAGNCLDERACRDCAKNVVAYMREVSADLERRRQEKLAVKRAEAAQRDREAAAERERARAEKREARQQRRQRELAAEAARAAAAEAEDEEEAEEEAEAPATGDAPPCVDRSAPRVAPRSHWLAGASCWRRLLCLLAPGLLLAACLLALASLVACLHFGHSLYTPLPQLEAACDWLVARAPEPAIDAAARLHAWLGRWLPPPA